MMGNATHAGYICICLMFNVTSRQHIGMHLLTLVTKWRDLHGGYVWDLISERADAVG